MAQEGIRGRPVPRPFHDVSGHYTSLAERVHAPEDLDERITWALERRRTFAAGAATPKAGKFIGGQFADTKTDKPAEADT